MNQIKLEELDFLYIYNQEVDWDNNRINFQKDFNSQEEMNKFINKLDKCHGDMKILLKDGMTLRISIETSLTKQDWENLLKVNFYGFILKNAKW
ncbi:MAG: hypothetical protein ACFFDF_23390 [Candidatus Odinarchaeota archaeon]